MNPPLEKRCDGCRFGSMAAASNGVIVFCRWGPWPAGAPVEMPASEWCWRWEDKLEFLALTTRERAERKT